jgi:spermidine synthase
MFHVKQSLRDDAQFSEELADGVALRLTRTRPPSVTRSAFQQIAVENNPVFGGLYRLDGEAMAAAADEFMIHECLVHAVALPHPAPKKALVLGGGDGASARELLKHPGLAVVVAELDPAVVAAVRRELPALPGGAFESPRVRLMAGDAAASLAQLSAAGERFDLILFDLTAPEDPACAHLHGEDFLHRCAAALTPQGCVHVQLGSPFYQPQRLAAVFPQRLARLISVPLYGGPWLLAAASTSAQPDPDCATLESRLAERTIGPLRYYNAALHGASRVLPNYVRALLA